VDRCCWPVAGASTCLRMRLRSAGCGRLMPCRHTRALGDELPPMLGSPREGHAAEVGATGRCHACTRAGGAIVNLRRRHPCGGARIAAPAPAASAWRAASSVHALRAVSPRSAQAGGRARYPTLWPHRDLVLLQQLVVLVVKLQRALAAALARAALARARAVAVARLLLVALALGRQEVVAVVVLVVALLLLLRRVRRRRAGLRLPRPRARRPRSGPGL